MAAPPSIILASQRFSTIYDFFLLLSIYPRSRSLAAQMIYLFSTEKRVDHLVHTGYKQNTIEINKYKSESRVQILENWQLATLESNSLGKLRIPQAAAKCVCKVYGRIYLESKATTIPQSLESIKCADVRS